MRPWLMAIIVSGHLCFDVTRPSAIDMRQLLRPDPMLLVYEERVRTLRLLARVFRSAAGSLLR
jgi:hypothetical protein